MHLYIESILSPYFFSLEKAYHTSWKPGTLVDLFKTGLHGVLPVIFLSDRHFKVGIRNIYSDSYSQEEGVP